MRPQREKKRENPPKAADSIPQSTYGVRGLDIPQLLELKKKFPSRMLEDRSTRFPVMVKHHGSTRENRLFFTSVRSVDDVGRGGTHGNRGAHRNRHL